MFLNNTPIMYAKVETNEGKNIFQKEQGEYKMQKKDNRKLKDHPRRAQHPNNRNFRKRKQENSSRNDGSYLDLLYASSLQSGPYPCRITSDFLRSFNSIFKLQGSNCTLIFWVTSLLTGVKSETQHKEESFWSQQRGSTGFHTV